MMHAEPIIRLLDLHKSFRNGREQILKGATLNFQKGKLTYILGPSGAGKSVIIKHILGLLKPDKGEVEIEGKTLSSLSPKAMKEMRHQFGVLFQNSALFDDFSIYENVAFPLREHTTLSEVEITRKVKHTLGLLGMKGSFDKLPNELSGGMKKRVGLARAIIREPSILLYDEPTTGLDPVTRTTVDELIETLKRELKLTSIVISHDISSALLLADEIVFLNQGRFIFAGPPSEFKKSKEEIIQEFLNAERRTLRAFQS